MVLLVVRIGHAALNIKDRVHPSYGLQRDGGNVMGVLAFPGVPLMSASSKNLRGAWLAIAVGAVEVVAAIRIGLQNALPSGEMPVWIRSC